jgi:hypothetical protein
MSEVNGKEAQILKAEQLLRARERAEVRHLIHEIRHRAQLLEDYANEYEHLAHQDGRLAFRLGGKVTAMLWQAWENLNDACEWITVDPSEQLEWRGKGIDSSYAWLCDTYAGCARPFDDYVGYWPQRDDDAGDDDGGEGPPGGDVDGDTVKSPLGEWPKMAFYTRRSYLGRCGLPDTDLDTAIHLARYGVDWQPPRELDEASLSPTAAGGAFTGESAAAPLPAGESRP